MKKAEAIFHTVYKSLQPTLALINSVFYLTRKVFLLM